MSLTLTKKEKKTEGSAKNASIDFSALMQVNLLPVEIKEKRSLRELQGKLVIALIAVVAVMILAYVAVLFEKSLAQDRYDHAVDRTTQLQTEQKKYAEVPQILSQISKSQDAIRDGMYREVLWKQYLGAIAGTIPDGGIIKTLSVDAATPNEQGPTTEDDLQGNSVGEITFAVNLEAIPDSTEWINRLNAIPGFADARLTAAVLSADAQGKEAYEVSGSVRMTEDIYSGRYEPETTEGVDTNASNS